MSPVRIPVPPGEAVKAGCGYDHGSSPDDKPRYFILINCEKVGAIVTAILDGKLILLLLKTSISRNDSMTIITEKKKK